MDARLARALSAMERLTIDFAEWQHAVQRSQVALARFDAQLELMGLDEVERLDTAERRSASGNA